MGSVLKMRTPRYCALAMVTGLVSGGSWTGTAPLAPARGSFLGIYPSSGDEVSGVNTSYSGKN